MLLTKLAVFHCPGKTALAAEFILASAQPLYILGYLVDISLLYRLAVMAGVTTLTYAMMLDIEFKRRIHRPCPVPIQKPIFFY